MTDIRPEECRYRLIDEGKSYPKNGCDVDNCVGVLNALCNKNDKDFVPISGELKSWSTIFKSMINLDKKSDIRHLNERDYKIGDIYKYLEFDQVLGEYTGRFAYFRITHKISNLTPCALSSVYLDNNAVILSVEPVYMREWNVKDA